MGIAHPTGCFFIIREIAFWAGLKPAPTGCFTGILGAGVVGRMPAVQISQNAFMAESNPIEYLQRVSVIKPNASKL